MNPHELALLLLTFCLLLPLPDVEFTLILHGAENVDVTSQTILIVAKVS